MKLNEIKLFESENGFLTDPVAIREWIYDNVDNSDILRESDIHILANGLVNIDDSVSFGRITHIMVNFGRVSGNVEFAMGNKLKSLKGCPQRIGGDFDAALAFSSSITSLADGPKSVGGVYSISCNPGPRQRELSVGITSFDGIPEDIKRLDIAQTGITSLTEIEMMFSKLTTITIASTQITTGGIGVLLLPPFVKIIVDDWPVPRWTEIINSYAGSFDSANRIFECQAELIENGFEEYAQL